MSRSSEEQIKNPAQKFFQWSSDDKALKYFDKSKAEKDEDGKIIKKGENVLVPLPFSFLVLDDLVTITGFYEKENSGFWSNEIKSHDLKNSILTVRSKSGIQAVGLYSDLGDVKAKGALYTKSLYIAYYEGDGAEKHLVIGNLKLSGAAVSAWIEYTNQNKINIYKGAFNIVDSTKEKKGKVVYYKPVFQHTMNVSEKANEAAKELDRELQAYLKQYLAAQNTNSGNGKGNGHHPAGDDLSFPPTDAEDYRTARDRMLHEGDDHPNKPFGSSPIAKSLGDLVTAKQLGMIRALAKEAGVDAEEECFDVLSCKPDELSKKAASAFITHLQDLEKKEPDDGFAYTGAKPKGGIDDDIPFN